MKIPHHAPKDLTLKMVRDTRYSHVQMFGGIVAITAHFSPIEYDWGVKQIWCYESFCYSPKSCKLYKRGADPMIPYKGDGSTPDSHGGFDEIFTEHRG